MSKSTKATNETASLPPPTSDELAARLRALSLSVVELKTERSTLVNQLTWLDERRKECLHLLDLRPSLQKHVAERQAAIAAAPANPNPYAGPPSRELEELLQKSDPASVEARLTLIRGGGMPYIGKVVEAYLDANTFLPRERMVERRIELPGIEALEARIAELGKRIAEQESELRELRSSSLPVFEAQLAELQGRARNLQHEQAEVARGLTNSSDVDQILALRGKAERLPLELLLTQQAMTDAELRCLDCAGEATTAERAQAKEKVVELEAKLQAVSAELLQARLALQRLNERGIDAGSRRSQLERKRAELADQLRSMATSTPVRRVAPTLAINGRVD